MIDQPCPKIFKQLLNKLGLPVVAPFLGELPRFGGKMLVNLAVGVQMGMTPRQSFFCIELVLFGKTELL